MKESLMKIVQENFWYANKCPMFGILGSLLFTHALWMSVYFRVTWKIFALVFEKSFDLHI